MKKLGLILSTLLLLATPVFGEVFVLDDFSKGLNTKLSPFTLPKSQGDIVENIRFDEDLTALSKRDLTVLYGTADASEAITGMYRLYLNDGSKVLVVSHGDEIEKGNDSTGIFTNILDLTSPDRRWNFITWHNILIGCDGYNNCIKYDGSSASATYIGSALAVDAGSGAGPDGTYTYKVTCYSTSYEANLDTASNPVSVTDNDITLTMIPICPDAFLGESVTGRKIYRIADGGSTYKLLSNGTIADNTTVTLTDSDADGALGATLSASHTRNPPKGRYLLIHRNRLWVANNPSSFPSRIYYSADASHDFFDTGNTVNGGHFDIRLNDGDEITFVKNLLGKLTISKNNTIQRLNADGDTPSTDWAISDPFSFVGCQAPYSAVNTNMGIAYLGNNGLYIFNGQYSQLFSDSVTPEIRDILPSNFPNVWSAYYKNKYYMAYTSNVSGSSVNNRILIFDFISDAYAIDILSRNALTVFNSGTDVEALYSGGSNDGKIYAHTETVKELIHNTHSNFSGTFDDMRYIPERVGGDPDSPILEISWTDTIDDQVGTIDSATGIIDRPDTNGNYISQYLTLNASSFDKLYWNETIPATGGDVTFSLRSGATTGDTSTASWSGTYTLSTGSDVSSVTANTIVQYQITMDTTSINFTPNIVNLDNYNIRLTYNTAGSTDETTLPLKWRSGWMDLGHPDNVKSLEKIYVYYETDPSVTGNLTLTFENFEGDTDVFTIDYFDNPKRYIEFFTGGEFIGNVFRLTIEESSLNPFILKKVVLRYKVQPDTFVFP